jgi:uncharacterized membrane protein (DUF106 family)
MEERIDGLIKELAEVKVEIKHAQEAQSECAQKNDETHDRLERKLDESMKFQMKLRLMIGFISTLLGALFIIIYHYAPQLWDALPKHGHTH